MKKESVEMLTAKQFAKRANVSYPTIIAWLAADLVPGADKQETPLGTFWQIPASSVEKVNKRKPGPTPKKAEGKGETADLPAITVAEMKSGEFVKTAEKSKTKKAGKRAAETKTAKKPTAAKTRGK